MNSWRFVRHATCRFFTNSGVSIVNPVNPVDCCLIVAYAVRWNRLRKANDVWWQIVGLPTGGGWHRTFWTRTWACICGIATSQRSKSFVICNSPPGSCHALSHCGGGPSTAAYRDTPSRRSRSCPVCRVVTALLWQACIWVSAYRFRHCAEQPLPTALGDSNVQITADVRSTYAF